MVGKKLLRILGSLLISNVITRAYGDPVSLKACTSTEFGYTGSCSDTFTNYCIHSDSTIDSHNNHIYGIGSDCKDELGSALHVFEIGSGIVADEKDLTSNSETVTDPGKLAAYYCDSSKVCAQTAGYVVINSKLYAIGLTGGGIDAATTLTDKNISSKAGCTAGTNIGKIFYTGSQYEMCISAGNSFAVASNVDENGNEIELFIKGSDMVAGTPFNDNSNVYIIASSVSYAVIDTTSGYYLIDKDNKVAKANGPGVLVVKNEAGVGTIENKQNAVYISSASTGVIVCDEGICSLKIDPANDAYYANSESELISCNGSKICTAVVKTGITAGDFYASGDGKLIYCSASDNCIESTKSGYFLNAGSDKTINHLIYCATGTTCETVAGAEGIYYLNEAVIAAGKAITCTTSGTLSCSETAISATSCASNGYKIIKSSGVVKFCDNTTEKNLPTGPSADYYVVESAASSIAYPSGTFTGSNTKAYIVIEVNKYSVKQYVSASATDGICIENSKEVECIGGKTRYVCAAAASPCTITPLSTDVCAPTEITAGRLDCYGYYYDSTNGFKDCTKDGITAGACGITATIGFYKSPNGDKIVCTTSDGSAVTCALVADANMDSSAGKVCEIGKLIEKGDEVKLCVDGLKANAVPIFTTNNNKYMILAAKLDSSKDENDGEYFQIEIDEESVKIIAISSTEYFVVNAYNKILKSNGSGSLVECGTTDNLCTYVTAQGTYNGGIYIYTIDATGTSPITGLITCDAEENCSLDTTVNDGYYLDSSSKSLILCESSSCDVISDPAVAADTYYIDVNNKLAFCKYSDKECTDETDVGVYLDGSDTNGDTYIVCESETGCKSVTKASLSDVTCTSNTIGQLVKNGELCLDGTKSAAFGTAGHYLVSYHTSSIFRGVIDSSAIFGAVEFKTDSITIEDATLTNAPICVDSDIKVTAKPSGDCATGSTLYKYCLKGICSSTQPQCNSKTGYGCTAGQYYLISEDEGISAAEEPTLGFLVKCETAGEECTKISGRGYYINIADTTYSHYYTCNGTEGQCKKVDVGTGCASDSDIGKIYYSTNYLICLIPDTDSAKIKTAQIGGTLDEYVIPYFNGNHLGITADHYAYIKIATDAAEVNKDDKKKYVFVKTTDLSVLDLSGGSPKNACPVKSGSEIDYDNITELNCLDKKYDCVKVTPSS